MLTKKQPTNIPATTAKESEKRISPVNKTRITIKYDVGFGNSLFLRGTGCNLSWNKGIPMKNTKKDEWVWEVDGNFQQGEFKVLVNDQLFEAGQNHPLICGKEIQYTPRFS